MIYRNVVIEICGKCNAKCEYCYTGQVNRNSKASDVGDYITIDDFSKALVYLREKGLVSSDTCFSLYHYGEPLMHPKLLEILQIMDAQGYAFELSTNGSIVPSIDAIPYLRNMKMLKFSMCGFSQSSYDKISTLSFQHVKANIVLFLKMLRSFGWKGAASLKFHVYTHNLDEVEQARCYAIENGMVFTPIHAIIGDLRAQVDWFDGCAETGFTETVNRDLLSSRMFHTYAKNMPDGWICPLTTDLVMDEHLNIMNCCMATRHDSADYYSLGNLLEFDDGHKPRCSSNLSRRCYTQGVGYAINNFPSYQKEEWIDSIRQILTQGEMDVIGGDFIYESFVHFFGGDGLTWKHYQDTEDFFMHSKNESGVILADSHFEEMRNKLLIRGIPKEQILAIYNLNLR